MDGDATEKTYPIFDIREGEVHRTQYTKAGTERLELATGGFDAVYLDQMDLDTGVKMRVWIDSVTAQVVKIHVMNRTIYLSDGSNPPPFPPHFSGGEALKPYLGNYLLAPRNAEFTVRHVDGGLAVDDPLIKETVRLQAPDERGGRLDEYGKNTICFDTDDDGKVISLTVDAVASFRKEGTD